jgi:hypothetical protein
MNYFLQVEENSPHGWTRYYLSCGGITTNISQAWSTTSLREAKRIKRHSRPRAIIVGMTDKDIFKARLTGEVRIS